MRTTSAAERSAVSAAAGHWCFAYLEVTADDGSWTNLGSLALGAEDLDFFNTATLSESIDANTISFSATLKRDIGSTNSLSPFRTDSLVNESQATPGTYAPRLDLHREWRLMVAVVPRDTTPVAPTDYTELNSGVVTKITVDGLSDTITIDGMGMEHDILRAFVVTDRTYSGDMEDVIQDALDDQLGVDVVPLYTPATPNFVVDDTIGDINLQPALSDIAALAGFTLRYRYSAADVNRYTLFEPPRDDVSADWSIADTEYEDLSAEVDASGIRNYIIVRYVDPTAGVATVIAPGAESGTVSCTGEVATFTTSQAGVLEDGARIVVDDVAYVVSGFNGTTSCTLEGAPDFASEQFYTSASITRYGLETMVIDLSEVVTTAANGVHYNEAQTGGVTAYSHTFENGMLVTTVDLAGSPKGRYATWKRIGSGNAATLVVPIVTNLAASWKEVLVSSSYVPGVFAVATVNDRAQSVMFELSASIDFTTVINSASVAVSNGTAEYGWVGSGYVSAGTVYYVRATPYSGPLSGSTPTGLAGDAVIAGTYTNKLAPTQADLDLISDSIDDLADSVGSLSSKEVFVNAVEDGQWLELSTIPTAEVEVGSEFRRQRSLVGVNSVRLNANIKTLTGMPSLRLHYTTNGFVATSSILSWTPTNTGLQSSSRFMVPAGAQADVGLTWAVAEGADTATLHLYELDAELFASDVVVGSPTASAAGVATVTVDLDSIVAGGSGTAPYEDNFDSGSSIDTTGARYTGANPWTLLNDSGATATVGSDQLTMVCPYSGAMSPFLAVQTLSAGDGAWRTQMSSANVGANYRGMGLVLRESATGKMLSFGFASDGPIKAQVRRMPNPNNTTFTTWTANYGNTSVADFNGYLEVERTTTSWAFRYSEDGSSWTTLTSGIAETTDFTTGPHQIGLWVAGSQTIGSGTTTIFERFWKV
jgi:hypothetical protein